MSLWLAVGLAAFGWAALWWLIGLFMGAWAVKPHGADQQVEDEGRDRL